MELQPTNLDLSSIQQSFLDDIAAFNIASKISEKFDDIIITGLKRKGFEFENKYDYIQFVQQNCRCEDNKDLKRRKYFAFDIPFLLHNYDFEIDLKTSASDRVFSISAICGNFAYIN